MHAIRACFIISMIILTARVGMTQPSYFNDIYNPNNTWSAGMSIIGTETGSFGCAISNDVTTGYFDACTFVLNQSGEMVHWNCFGRYGADFYPGDDAALIKRMNNFALFGSVNDWMNGATFGLLYEFDQSGDTLYTRTFTNDSDSVLVGRSCAVTSDNGLVLLGNIQDDVSLTDIILIKLDSLGNEIWRRTYGTESDDWAKSIIQTPDNGYVFGCMSWISGIVVTCDPTVFKTDSLGNFEWFINLGSQYMDDQAMVCNTQDSCIMVLTVYADSMWTPEYSYAKINLVKIDLDGNIIWNKKYGPSKPVNFSSSIISLENGDFMACGHSKYSAYLYRAGWLLRFNSNGDSLWYRDYYYYPEDPSWGVNYLYDLDYTSDHGFIATGEAYTLDPPNNGQKMWVLKVDSVGCEIPNCWVGIEEEENDRTVRLYDGKMGELVVWPNPCREVLNVKCLGLSSGNSYSLSVFDIYGRIVLSSPFKGGGREGGETGGGVVWKLNTTSLPPGVYFISVLDEGKRVAGGKFVVAR